MKSSRRQFLTGVIALGTTPLLAQDEPEKLPHTLDQSDFDPIARKVAWEKERRDVLERLKVCNKLERILLERYVAPFDTWLNLEGYMKIPTLRKAVDRLASDAENRAPIDPVWFLLKIRSLEPIKGSDIWLKFSLTDEDRQMVLLDQDHEGNENALVPEPFKDTMWRKRDSLLDVLEHHFVQIMEDEECKRTMVDGIPNLYLLFGPEQDPSKVLKEQLLA